MIYAPAQHTRYTPKTFLRRIAWPMVRRTVRSYTVDTPQGRFCLPLDLDDSISKSLFIHKNYELDFMRAAMRQIRTMVGDAPRRTTIIDIGANHGVTSIGMIRLNECQQAFAFEPAPRNFELL